MRNAVLFSTFVSLCRHKERRRWWMERVGGGNGEECIDMGKGGGWEDYMKSFFGEPCPFWNVATTFLLSSTKVKDTCQILDICPNVIRSLKVFRSDYGATKADVPTSRFHWNSTNLSSSLTNRPNHQTRPDQTRPDQQISLRIRSMKNASHSH